MGEKTIEELCLLKDKRSIPTYGTLLTTGRK